MKLESEHWMLCKDRRVRILEVVRYKDPVLALQCLSRAGILLTLALIVRIGTFWRYNRSWRTHFHDLGINVFAELCGRACCSSVLVTQISMPT